MNSPAPSEDSLYLSAPAAAEALGVSMATLYTYASRGLLRVQKSPGQRESRYWRSDVERMRSRGSVPGGLAALATTSRITLVTETGTYYRACNVVELAETHTLEEVAGLLWDIENHDAFAGRLPNLPQLNPGFVEQITGLELSDRIAVLAPFMERANPQSYDGSRHGFADAAAGMMRWAAGLMTGQTDISSDLLHLQVLEGVPEDRKVLWGEVARRLLVVSADHDLDPTTLAARAVANTGVTPYRVLVAALMTAEGRRGVQVRTRAANKLLNELDQSDGVTPITARLKAGEALPGFGSWIHVGGDSRVETLLATYRRFLSDDPDIIRFLRVVDLVRDATGLGPQFILTLLVFNRKLPSFERELSLLHLGRIAGWIAHALEQAGQEVVRPRSLYRGALPE